jgi:hypothetical protein
MAEKIRSRQSQILELLLENKTGLSIDEYDTPHISDHQLR